MTLNNNAPVPSNAIVNIPMATSHVRGDIRREGSAMAKILVMIQAKSMRPNDGDNFVN
jgi:hypothetical protein